MNISRLLVLAPVFFLALDADKALAQKPDVSRVPGVVIAHRPASTRQYIGSPSIAALPGGDYVVAHDVFGPGSSRDRTFVYASSDQGRSWEQRAEIVGQWWSTLFWHKDALYLLGTSKEYGFTVIRRSRDGGKTWTTPRDAQSGLLLADGRYHCAPVPVIVHNQRLWRAMEDAMGPGGWGSHFRAFMMSAPVEADLLLAASWTCSNRLGRNPQWLEGKFGGWLEGNAVVTPSGDLVNILRVDYRTPREKAALVRISADGRTATFNPQADFIDFPGGCKKFTIRFDPSSKHYWTLANLLPAGYQGTNPGMVRNTLGLLRSADLRHWEVRATLLHHPDQKKHAFQYVDWLFAGTDLLALSRTAYEDGLGGAHNQHDANFLTFHRFGNFRDQK